MPAKAPSASPSSLGSSLNQLAPAWPKHIALPFLTLVYPIVLSLSMADTMITPEEPDNAGYEFPLSPNRRHWSTVHFLKSSQLLAALEQQKQCFATVLGIAFSYVQSYPAQQSWGSSGFKITPDRSSGWTVRLANQYA